MIRKLALAALLVTLGTVSAFAADISGKWTADVQGRNGTQTMTFNFTVSGSTVTGKVTTARGDADRVRGPAHGFSGPPAALEIDTRQAEPGTTGLTNTVRHARDASWR